MGVWAGAVYQAGQLMKYGGPEKSVIDILKERGENSPATIEKAKRLQTILNRATNQGAERYENYDDLLRDLEALLS